MSDLGPAPAGQLLTVNVECTGSPVDRFGVLHPVTIRPDWTVHTVHDLDAERVGVLFGGWCSCLHFVERIVPAFREGLQLMAAPRGLPRDGDVWDNFPSQGCPQSKHFHHDLEAAVRHELSAAHVSGQYGADGWADRQVAAVAEAQFRAVMSAAAAVWANAADPDLVTGGRDGYLELWAAGMLPTQVAEIAAAFPDQALSFSTAFFRRIHFHGIDIDWLQAVVTAYPTGLAEWAAQLDRGSLRVDPRELRRMRDLGLTGHDAIGLIEAGVPLAAVTELAVLPNVSGSTAARWLTLWYKIGVHPGPDHYQVLAAHQALHDRPSHSTLDMLCNSLDSVATPLPDRTEVAVMLALTGDPERVSQAVRRGVRRAVDLVPASSVPSGISRSIS
ncbi:hypothetical protein [Microbacterium candidum]|uniref:DUF4192 family protein n=1 Tax=Microbacterium candidum TaxID=3041922 RepID=A0ABT7MW02_9MICO|nr:hypothetical protein [Microbacterium sp. ASV49]MDL9978638.1 hypothetical protein [Microbacterium sp. ASV49]